MKKLIALLAACPTLAFAQTPNTLPTTGNVGLGTTAPACKLEVVGNARVTGKTEFDSTLLVRDSVRFESDTKIDGNVFVGGDATFNNRISVAGAIENPYIAHPSELRMVGLGPDGQYRAMDPAFVTSAAYNAACFNQVDKFGNPVGVVPGWASNNGAPSAQTIGVMYTGVPCLAHIGINTDAPLSPLEVNGPANLTEESLVRFLAGGNELARITNKGNIGVGIIAPVAKLHIVPDAGLPLFVGQGSGISTTIDNYGRVGIGINSPAAALHVDVNLGDAYAVHFRNASSTGAVLLVEGNSSSQPILTVRANTNTHSQPDFDVFEIGANGVTYAREIIVDLNAWPDYVFEDGYNLMPLDSVSSYIDTYGHLPGVPSAQEMTTAGMNVAQTNVLLMQKLEETTLYLIELHRQNDALRKEMDALKQKIQKQ